MHQGHSTLTLRTWRRFNNGLCLRNSIQQTVILRAIWTDSQYFIAVDILDNDANKAKRKAILLSSIGGATYKTLKDLSFPQQPHEKSFEDLCKLLKGQYKPKRLMVAERFRFHNAKQAPGQSICDFAAHLKKLAVYCEFTLNQPQDSLRDRLICGLLSESIQKKLLARNYTFQQALDVALAEEAAARNVRDMTTVEGKAVNRMVSSRKMQKSRKPSNTTRRCDRCGLTNHSRDECRYKNATCYKCKKVGHLQSECRSDSKSGSVASATRTKGTSQYHARSKARVRYVDENDYEHMQEVRYKC